MLEGAVCITGGTGFIGRAILRRAEREQWPARFTVFSRDESKLYRVQQRWPDVRCIRGSVTGSVERLAGLFAGHETVIHAAANKMVDLGEFAAFDTVDNNVTGTVHVAQACMVAGVGRAVFISSDKAVQPVNIYGMSKAAGERVWQEADGITNTAFVATRYGNVVGSTASVVEHFRRQLSEDGVIQVTNPEMTRFYMSADEAIDCILYAVHRAQRGSVVIPRLHAMGLADMARLALGMKPEDLLVNARVRVTGARPGEKVHESLLHEQESVRVLWGDGSVNTGYYELRPVGETHGGTPFAITSARPQLGWLSYERMAAMIEDAKDV